jgi:hypothetical protein
MADQTTGNTDLSSAIDGYIAQLASRYGTPQTLPYIQHSAYLQQALQQERAQGGQNLKSPLALGSNLLAEAIDQFSARRAQQQLMQHTAADQATYDQNLQNLGAGIGAWGSGMGQPGGAPPAGASGDAVAGGGGAASPPAATAPASPAPGASSPTAPAPAPAGDPVLAHVVQHYTAEGYPPAAAAGLAGGFAQESGFNPNAVNKGEGAIGLGQWRGPRAAAFNQFAQANHLDPTSLDTQLAFSDHELNGPEGRARGLLMAATTPAQGAAADNAYERPQGYKPGGDPSAVSGWNTRLGVANSAFAQANAPTGPQSTASGDQSPPTPRPVQVGGASTSLPAPNASGPVGASPAPVQQSAFAPGGYRGPPTGPAATPQELQMIAAYRASPNLAMREKGEELMQSIIARHSTPVDAKTPAWNPQTGQFQAQPGMSDQIDASHSTPDALVTTNAGTGAIGSVRTPGGIVDNRRYNPATGGYDPIPGLQHQQVGQFAPGTVADVDPSGKATVVQAPQTTPDAVRSAANDYFGSDSYKGALASVNAANAVQRILASAKANGGMVDMATMDNVLKAETGLSAKQGGMTMLLEHGGFPNEVQGALSNLVGQGFVPVSQVRDAVNIVRQYATTEQRQAQAELAQRNAMMRNLSGGSYDLSGISAPQLDAMPNVPWLNATDQPGLGPGPGSAPGPGPAPPPHQLPPGWPQGVNPNSPAGQAATQLLARGYRFQNGQWTK